MSRHFVDEDPYRDEPYDRHEGVSWLPRYGWQGSLTGRDPQRDPESGIGEVPMTREQAEAWRRLPGNEDPFAERKAGERDAA